MALAVKCYFQRTKIVNLQFCLASQQIKSDNCRFVQYARKKIEHKKNEQKKNG